ncbi:ATP-grasp domain-containing protein [Poriferisphaera sp. WC338]|uniref:ATP-grasp domain-containing protein n=1 Tax=Poriferisphaera sp. WC338 TaxID=3425129 RepID=UPI003D81BB99
MQSNQHNNMKLAIHHEGSWCESIIQHCNERNISYKIVNCLDTDILDQIKECDGLIWAFSHLSPTHILMARSVLNSAKEMGISVFPDYESTWHFDDKLSQKYLFEALDLSVAKAWAFFDKDQALNWINSSEASIPIVGKLRRGAGSYNVKLLRSKQEASSYINRMFGKGYSPAPARMADISTKLQVAMKNGGIKGIIDRAKKAPRFFRMSRFGAKFHAVEKGYVYFQQFIPGNTCDYRLTVVGDRVWGYRRMVRSNDFRASGSGMVDYDPQAIPAEVVKLAIDSADKLKMNSVCFDFVRDDQNRFYLVEISYGFVSELIHNCEGYWDRNLEWYKGHVWPTDAILDDFINLISSRGAEI